MTEPNIPLLRKAVEWVETESQKDARVREWDQTHWIFNRSPQARKMGACGTVYCVAGYVAHLEGLTKVRAGEEWLDPEAVRQRFDMTSLSLGVVMAEVAKRLLGITDEEADALFNGKNDVYRIREIADAIAERAGEQL